MAQSLRYRLYLGRFADVSNEFLKGFFVFIEHYCGVPISLKEKSSRMTCPSCLPQGMIVYEEGRAQPL